jgi:hypothetical protein
MKFLYHLKYIVLVTSLSIIVCGIVKKIPLLILLGTLLLIFICTISIKEILIIKKWEKIIEPISKNIPERKVCELYSNNKEYRLGDMITIAARWTDSGEKYHFKTFPNSIATEYMKKSKTQRNYSILENILRERTKKTDDLPGDKDLVVHLRVGDVVEYNKSSLIEIITKYTHYNLFSPISNYTCPIRNIQEKLDKLNGDEIQKIILVAGSHYNILTPKSCRYIDIMKKYLEDKGYNVELRLGKEPDADFVFMSNSKYFIPSCSGNYTKLIKVMVKIMGGKVL